MEKLADQDFVETRFYKLAVARGIPKKKVEKRIAAAKVRL